MGAIAIFITISVLAVGSVTVSLIYEYKEHKAQKQA